MYICVSVYVCVCVCVSVYVYLCVSVYVFAPEPGGGPGIKEVPRNFVLDQELSSGSSAGRGGDSKKWKLVENPTFNGLLGRTVDDKVTK